MRTLSPALAGLLDARELAEEDRQEQFAGAVATFLVGLARQAGGAILYLDDVQWLDAGTRRVLRHLAEDLARHAAAGGRHRPRRPGEPGGG